MVVIDVTGNHVVLQWRARPDKKARRVSVAPARFHHLFDLGFCTTISRAQGSTIDEPYNVFDIDCLTAEEMYVAISRGRSLAAVHVDYKRAGTYRFRPHKYPANDPVSWDPEPTPVVTGVLYEITNSCNAKVYIGQTVVGEGSSTVEGATEKRFLEHAGNTDAKSGIDKAMKDLGASNFTVAVVSSSAYTAARTRGTDGRPVTPSQLLKDELDLIRRRRRDGCVLYNIKGARSGEQSRMVDVKRNPHLAVHYASVTHDKGRKGFRVCWVDEQKRPRENWFGYGKRTRRKRCRGRFVAVHGAQATNLQMAKAAAHAFVTSGIRDGTMRSKSVSRNHENK
jgi:hypothetical protein